MDSYKILFDVYICIVIIKNYKGIKQNVKKLNGFDNIFWKRGKIFFIYMNRIKNISLI